MSQKNQITQSSQYCIQLPTQSASSRLNTDYELNNLPTEDHEIGRNKQKSIDLQFTDNIEEIIENLQTNDVQEKLKFQLPEKRQRQTTFTPKMNLVARLFMLDQIKMLFQYSRLCNNFKKSQKLELEDAPFLGEKDESTYYANKFEQYLKKNDIKKLSPLKMLFFFFQNQGPEFFQSLLTQTLFVLIKLTNSILINVLLDFITDYNNDQNGVTQENVYLIVSIICVLFLLGQVFMHFGNRQATVLLVKMRSTFMNLIFNKTVNLSQHQIKETNIGKLINLCSTDFNIVEIKIQPLIFAMALPVTLLGSLIILITRFGYMGIVSFVVALLGVVLQITFGGHYQKEAIKRSQINDQRVKLTSELIEGIRLIKMYTWEKEFKKMVEVIRKKELFRTFLFFIYMYAGLIINHSITFIALSIQILFFLKFDQVHQITTGKIFSTLELLNFLKQNMIIAILGITGYKDFINIMIRTKQILCIQENSMINLDSDDSQQKQQSPNQEQNDDSIIEIKNFFGYWNYRQQNNKQIQQKSEIDLEKQEQEQQHKQQQIQQNNQNQAVLKNINIEIKSGQKIAIVGSIGSGKSSFLLSILKELPFYQGIQKIKGSIAYVEQEPYIFNGTVKDNIVLGSDFDEQRYEQTVQNCCLLPDFQDLQYGDKTQIGERGINLSGGQKARISLARAVYQNADIYLLDDPFSAVDAKTGKKINQNILGGLLKHKTILFATHQLHLLKNANEILVFKNGKIEQKGNFQQIKEHILELAGKQNQQLVNIREKSILQTICYNKDINQDKKIEQKQKQQPQNLEKQILSEIEGNEVIQVNFKSYMQYLKYAGGFLFGLFLLLVLLIDQSLFIYAHVFIGKIVNEDDKYLYLSQLAYFITALCFVRIFLIILANFMHIMAVKGIHNQLIEKLFFTKTQFFDQVSSGIIINRFSNDLGIVDITLFSSLIEVITFQMQIICLLIYLCYINPWLIILFSLMAIILTLFLRNSKKALEESKKLDLQYKSPVFSFFSQTLQGTLQIKIYNQIKNFTQLFNNLVDDSFRSSYLYQHLIRPFTYFSQMISIIFSILGIYLVVYLTLQGFQNPLQVGYAILYLIFVSETVQYCLKQMLNVDMSMNSTVRIINYINNLPQEKPYNKIQDVEQKEFIQKADIQFKNVCLKYRKNLDLVLKNINFNIQNGEKVACVGRTGAGKSSLIQALFRIHEIEDFDDNQNTGIFMGGKRIQDYGLKIVRNSMSIIPQTPFVFSGTIRNNLDPLNQYTDDQIIEVLKDIELFELVTNLPQGIQTDMTNVGSLFSTGQKQLICLGRCILKKSKILVLDEATANVDMKTDEFIQKKIKEKFSDCTVFTIAHRLNTIADYDKILVMEKGEVAEYDTPYNLLVQNVGDNKITKHQSIFAQMVKKTGHANSNQIFQIAYENYLKMEKIMQESENS